MKRACIHFIMERWSIIGAEIGVYEGYNALDMLQHMPNLKLLYLIDPYVKYDGWVSPWADKVSAMKSVARKRLSPFQHRTRWIYKKFEECTREDIPHALDFIYIDGNHGYEYVKKDIELGVQFVKPNGVVGGHDYSGGWAGVKKAVDEYVARHNLELFTGQRDGSLYDWWFIRP